MITNRRIGDYAFTAVALIALSLGKSFPGTVLTAGFGEVTPR